MDLRAINVTEVSNLARSSDYIVVCVGEGTYAEKPGDIDDLGETKPKDQGTDTLMQISLSLLLFHSFRHLNSMYHYVCVLSALPRGQVEYVELLASFGKPVIMVIISGRPRLLHDAVMSSHAILDALVPGPKGGLAIAEILTGSVVPSGRLPFRYLCHQLSPCRYTTSGTLFINCYCY